VLVAFGTARPGELVELLRSCDRHRCQVLFVPRFYELHQAGRQTETVGGLPLIRLRSAGRQRPSWRLKRAVDLVLAAAGLVLAAPVMAACALAIRLEGGPGVLFRQERIGMDERRFTMIKLRTLRPASEWESRTRWSVANDPRLGPVGRFLRATSLDEVPQLANVLRGEMSLVGPRPERPFFVEEFSRRIPDYAARHRVRAGLTGWAAVNGLRGDTSIETRVSFDNSYIENWSLWLDIKIMIRTVGAVLARSSG
jgi:exopolysaccharide biosynthesis polyprenyl glycosylphosphotransferase